MEIRVEISEFGAIHCEFLVHGQENSQWVAEQVKEAGFQYRYFQEEGMKPAPIWTLIVHKKPDGTVDEIIEFVKGLEDVKIIRDHTKPAS